MRHSHTMRNYAKAFFAFAALATIGACSDNTAAPSAQPEAVFTPANFARVGNVVTFRVNNSQGATQRIGAHLINFPAGAICELGKSGYGATYWDKPCDPLKGSIVITAIIMEDGDNQPYIDFQPAMRFVPNKEVMLFMRQGYNTSKKELGVKWCNNVGVCTDESLTDPSLKPFRLGRTPYIGRRVKHFSGFLVYTQGDCSGTAYNNGDGTWWCDDGGFSRRSGYMVASGKDVSDLLDDNDQDDKGKKDENQ